MNIQYSRLFIKRYKRLPNDIKLLLVDREIKFKLNPKDPSLKLHQLTGNQKGCYSFSVNYQYRVIVTMEADGFTFINVGTHEIYK